MLFEFGTSETLSFNNQRKHTDQQEAILPSPSRTAGATHDKRYS